VPNISETILLKILALALIPAASDCPTRLGSSISIFFSRLTVCLLYIPLVLLLKPSPKTAFPPPIPEAVLSIVRPK